MTNLNITVIGGGLIGGGLIGASWSAHFLVRGHRIFRRDALPDAEAPLLAFEPDLAHAVKQADVVRECDPERQAVKQKRWADIERHCRPQALLSSSAREAQQIAVLRALKNPSHPS